MAAKRRFRGKRDKILNKSINSNSDTSENIGDSSISIGVSGQEDIHVKIDSNNNNRGKHSEHIENNLNRSTRSLAGAKKTIFVTVGTTKFDKLINKVMSQEFIRALNDLNYTDFIIQTGISEYEYKKGERLQLVNSNVTYDNGNKTANRNNIKTIIYDYKQSIIDDIEMADLVVGHAGAGTCLEVLRKHKKLLVVINEDLMDNHQFELAQQLSEDKYLMCSNINNLKESLIKISRQNVKFNAFPQQDVNRMARILDDVLSK